MPVPLHRPRIAAAVVALFLVAGACFDGGSDETTTSVGTVTSTSSNSEPPSKTAAGTTGAPVTTGVSTSTTPAPADLPPPPTSTVAPDDDQIAEPGDSVSPTGLEVETLCLTAVPAAILSWSVAEGMGESLQRIDIATARNGFDLRVFASGTVEPGRSAVLWDQAASGAVHYWRVLTMRDDIWYPSETATFNGPFCIADQPGNG